MVTFSLFDNFACSARCLKDKHSSDIRFEKSGCTIGTTGTQQFRARARDQSSNVNMAHSYLQLTRNQVPLPSGRLGIRGCLYLRIQYKMYRLKLAIPTVLPTISARSA